MVGYAFREGQESLFHGSGTKGGDNFVKSKCAGGIILTTASFEPSMTVATVKT